MKTYSITLKRVVTKGFFRRERVVEKRILERVKHNSPLGDLKNHMLVVFEDDSQEVINLDKYDGYELPKDFFMLTKNQMNEESGGVVNL